MNRLAHETSPYLLQHAHNPVDWYPWGEEALARARAEDKPILLSIGYAACHWCHVMERESFEDPETAAIMNRSFVNIKVDREERPDLDSIYMDAVVALTGSGGWPMTVFLTPAGEPFYGGTYYPPTPRYGMPSFRQLLLGLAGTWERQREEVVRNALGLAGHIRRDYTLAGQGHVLDALLPERAVQQLGVQFDRAFGGFGGAPKFPPSMTLEFLLRRALDGDGRALEMAEQTLRHMAAGGIYDQIGGGFARYATDARWLVPHFEKMLYDNAQLARVYLHAWQLTGNPLYRRIVEETLDWTLREMTHPDGGFYSSLDADSAGEEGRFYVWEAAEIAALLGADAPLFLEYYAVTPQGNWEAQNILHTPRPLADVAAAHGLTEQEAEARLAAARRALYAARAQRVWPGLDDKVLTAWNGLMLAALAEAGRALGRADYTAAATRNAAFLFAVMRRADGRLWRTWRAGGAAKYAAYLEDYACLADGLLALYQATHADDWFVWAQELADLMLTHFADAEGGGFFDTADDHEALLFRPKTLQDNATPSGNAMAARVLLTLGLLTGHGRYRDTAEEMVSALYPAMAQYPTGFGCWLGVAWQLLADTLEVAVVGEPADPAARALADVVWEAYRPQVVLAVGQPESAPLLVGRTRLDGRPAAYVCRNFACRLPVATPDALRAELTSRH